MNQNFSLLKAIRNVANGKTQDELTSAVLEAGAEEMRKAGINSLGQITLPNIDYRTVTVASEHDDVVATDLMDIITPLRAKNVLVAAGAKMLTGLQGDVQYPVMSSVNTYWSGETADVSTSTPTYTNVKLSPKRLACVVPVSKQFLVQDSVGAENALREEIINAINSKLEETLLGTSAGSTTQPAGLFYCSSPLTDVSTFKGVCDIEADIEEAHIDGAKYILSPKGKSALRGMTKGSNTSANVYVDGEVDGTPAFCTSHISNSKGIYGDFSQLVLASWGNVDIVVDTVTLAASGCVRLIVNCFFDAKPLRTSAFKAFTIS